MTAVIAVHAQLESSSATSVNMAPQQDAKRRTGRKLTKKRKPQRNPSVQYPDRLKVGDDVHDDVTASKGQSAQQMNQSVFSMIAAAGSKVDFHARFEDESSDSEDEDDPSTLPYGLDMHNTDILTYKNVSEQKDQRSTGQELGKQQLQLREPTTLKSLPKHSLRTIKEKDYMSESSGMPFIEPPLSISSPTSITPRDAPVMSRMLEAQAQLGASADGLNMPKVETDLSGKLKSTNGPSNLVIRLKEIFGFEKPEEVISGMFDDLQI